MKKVKKKSCFKGFDISLKQMVFLTKQMAHEIGLIDATPTTGLTAGLLCAIFVLWFLVDRLLMTSAM